eukprot:TRINITY_DN3001_c0_g1_i5.p1 TRINITY_DN3001_c0_g1~~TRINITY_DN3001_c0_g1_i5.p1  ORF type:complete len:860 (-),score=192.34 TRINITY_DN3001_c0_g1_i5:379-2958(-)
MGCAHSSASGSNAREPEKQAGPVLLGPQPLSKKCVIADSSETGSPDVETFAVLRVLRGELNRSFDSYGKMDPFAIVEWIEPDGTRKKLSTTRTDWNAHMSPVWDHTCRGQPFKSRDDQVEFQVMEGNVIGRPTFCGSARISMGELLGEMAASFSPSEQGTFAGPVLDLALRNAEEVTGSVKVQALLVCRAQSDGASVPGGSLTKVDPSLFEKDIEQLGVSGGSAPFFKLRLREAKERRPDHFIGKDLSHAEDEVLFYEQALALRQQPGAGGLAGLLRFTFEYAGVLSNDESTCDAAKGRELLVMKNLRSGREQLRLLDIKIGQKTAQAGWQGKSRAAALRQSLVDGITNSSCEGFRVEGFDGRPPALSSMDPLLDLGMTGNAKMLKKADRIMLQRMTGAEMLMHFLDVHQEPIDVPDAAMQEVLTPIEIAEIVAHEVVSRLAQLAIACRRSPAPQKWIGSSVGLGFDAGHLPPRAQGEGQLRKAVLVNIFDWGRSELNTFESHMSLSDKDQHDRCEFWRYYIGGIDRLAWEAARAYRHRFACTRKWSHITFKISDFDSMSENDFIGKLTVAVEETPETTAELMRHSGNQVVSDYGIRGCSTLTYSIAWRAYPKGSRLRGAWQIHVARANKLPRQDKIQLRTTSDPLCEITAVSEGSVHCFRQVSSVKVKNLDPEWGETFHLPVASEAGALEAALEEAASGLGTAVSRIFPPELMPQWQKEGPTLGISSAKSHSRWSWSETASPSEADEQAKVLTSWKLRLDAASATDSASSPSWRGDNEESVAGGRTENTAARGDDKGPPHGICGWWENTAARGDDKGICGWWENTAARGDDKGDDKGRGLAAGSGGHDAHWRDGCCRE